MAVLIILPIVSAASLEVKKTDRGSVIISELGNPAKFRFDITNLGAKDNFEIYTLVGVTMSPRGTFLMDTGKTSIDVEAYLSKEVLKAHKGVFSFEYQIRGQNSGIFKDLLQVKIVPLAEAIKIETEPINPTDENVVVVIKNTQNIDLEGLEITGESSFFEFSESLDLKPFEEKSITLDLDKEKIKKLKAGTYLLSYDIKYGKVDSKSESVIKYLEKEGTSVEDDTTGFVIRERIVKKTNEGNTDVNARIEMSNDIFSRLLTTYSEEPLETNRTGFIVHYVWERGIAPSESFEVVKKTNYTFPFIVIVLALLVVFLVRYYSLGIVSVNKKVHFVRTKSGDFALKVNLRVKARQNVDNAVIVDTLPGMTKLYEKYGKKPDKVDVEKRKIMWDIGSLKSGEARVFSYIIYSKIRTVGRFELPYAEAVFEKAGRKFRAYSNKVYFVADMIGRED